MRQSVTTASPRRVAGRSVRHAPVHQPFGAMTATLAQSHLAALLRDLETTRTATERLGALSDAQLTWRPEPSVWSIGDCFEHLRIVDEGYGRAIREALDRADPGAAAFAPTWYAKQYIRFVSPDSTLKLPTVKAMVPKVESPSAGADAMRRFLAQQAELEALVRDADAKNINTGRFRSPRSSGFRWERG